MRNLFKVVIHLLLTLLLPMPLCIRALAQSPREHAQRSREARPSRSLAVVASNRTACLLGLEAAHKPSHVSRSPQPSPNGAVVMPLSTQAPRARRVQWKPALAILASNGSRVAAACSAALPAHFMSSPAFQMRRSGSVWTVCRGISTPDATMFACETHRFPLERTV